MLQKASKVFMNFRRISCCLFSTSPSSTQSSSLPWISPLHLPKPTSSKPDPPTDASFTPIASRRKTRYISHDTAIKLITNERDPQHALEIFNMVSEQKGFNHNNDTYACILHKLAQKKKFQAIDAVLRQMTYETCKFHEGIFLTIMKHFSRSKLHEKVLDVFHAIQPIVREKPSLKAISTCLNILIEANRIDLARDFLLHSRKKLNLQPNTCIFNILVKHHCKNGDLDAAFEVVKEMKGSKISYPDLSTYSTLMGGLCGFGRLKEAIELFEEMVSKDQIMPDPLTYNVLINGFCRVGKVDRAKKIMDFMKTNGCNPNIVNYSTLMNGFCKEGRFQEAKEIFNQTKSLGMIFDTVGYTTLINCFCSTGGIDEAMDLLREMNENGCKADIVTFNVTLKGLCRESRFGEALGMLEKLPYEGIHLNKASYRIVLNILSQKGELKKANELLDLMLSRGFRPHYATSNELLVRLCKAGMVDDAAMCLIGLVEMGFKPELDSWAILVELICREREILSVFELLDELVIPESGYSPIFSFQVKKWVSEVSETFKPWCSA